MARRLFAAAVLCAALPALAATDKRASEEDRDRLRARIGDLQKSLASAEESRSEAADALKSSEKAVSEANRALFELAQGNRKLGEELEAIARQGTGLKADMEVQQAHVESLLRLQYVQGAQDRLRLVIEGRDLSTVQRHLEYYAYLSRARAEVLAGLRKSSEQVALLEQETLRKRAELAANQEAQSREKQQLERERGARAAMLKRISGTIAQQRREIGRLQRDEARLTKLIEEIGKALAARPADKSARKGRPVDEVADASAASRAFASLKGRMKFPVKGELMNRYGSPREEGGAVWKGLFIRASTGQSVHAVADGRVVYADWLRGFGNLLILDHGGGYMSLYGNNEGLLRQLGDPVRAGDEVAQVGATGGVEESGLYFELRHEGKPFDPVKWVGK
jgi:septal ring factor EnvC (AmiA/AmiB activator)